MILGWLQLIKGLAQLIHTPFTFYLLACHLKSHRQETFSSMYNALTAFIYLWRFLIYSLLVYLVP